MVQLDVDKSQTNVSPALRSRRRTIRLLLQNHPTPLVWAWKFTEAILQGLSPIFRRVGVQRSSRWVTPIEAMVKTLIFECHMCGQCVLHVTGMTCPMTCPKQLRNGPCGGVRMDGTCEIDQTMGCVWVSAVKRSARTIYHQEIRTIQTPVDWRLEGASTWVTFAIEYDTADTAVGRGSRSAPTLASP